MARWHVLGSPWQKVLCHLVRYVMDVNDEFSHVTKPQRCSSWICSDLWRQWCLACRFQSFGNTRFVDWKPKKKIKRSLRLVKHLKEGGRLNRRHSVMGVLKHEAAQMAILSTLFLKAALDKRQKLTLNVEPNDMTSNVKFICQTAVLNSNVSQKCSVRPNTWPWHTCTRSQHRCLTGAHLCSQPYVWLFIFT